MYCEKANPEETTFPCRMTLSIAGLRDAEGQLVREPLESPSADAKSHTGGAGAVGGFAQRTAARSALAADTAQSSPANEESAKSARCGERKVRRT